MLTGEIPFDSHFFSEVASLWKNGVMVLIALGFIFLAIHKGFEPLLLIPIGVGIMLANVPFGGLGEGEGLLVLLKRYGLSTELFPLLMFLGLGALTDFTPLIQRPWMALLGAAGADRHFRNAAGGHCARVHAGECRGHRHHRRRGRPDGNLRFDSPRRRGSARSQSPSRPTPTWRWSPSFQPPIMRALTSKSERMVEMPYEPRPRPEAAQVAFSR